MRGHPGLKKKQVERKKGTGHFGKKQNEDLSKNQRGKIEVCIFWTADHITRGTESRRGWGKEQRLIVVQNARRRERRRKKRNRTPAESLNLYCRKTSVVRPRKGNAKERNQVAKNPEQVETIGR